eukprot:GHVU01221156.1.p1 GENE.GHVU01221156.1~~GHVU01221156.1.p1  ORF type:complete len:129 (+),score=0.72 GHVU01221156.1:3-389(+)
MHACIHTYIHPHWMCTNRALYLFNWQQDRSSRADGIHISRIPFIIDSPPSRPNDCQALRCTTKAAAVRADARGCAPPRYACECECVGGSGCASVRLSATWGGRVWVVARRQRAAMTILCRITDDMRLI